MRYKYQDLIQLFNNTFFEQYNTRLIKGGDEPLYLPAKSSPTNQCSYHQIIFAHGYYASAFHEISHWCHAGEKRRLLEDFGYWYNPDGRTKSQQRTFEQVEIKPQAMEWMFSVAADHRFNISADNLSADIGASQEFVVSVVSQVKAWCEVPMPDRSLAFTRALSEYFGTEPFCFDHYCLPTT